MSPPQRFSFVNARPQTKAEKRQTRTAIRSHIGRWTQEKQQKLEGAGATGSTDERSSSSPESAPRTISLPPTERGPTASHLREVAWTEGSASETGKNEPDREHPENEDDDLTDFAVTAPTQAQRRTDRRSTSATISNPVIQAFGAGTLDPFDTSPTNFPSSLISQCHEYCKPARLVTLGHFAQRG
jgi:hypothetical protein